MNHNKSQLIILQGYCWIKNGDHPRSNRKRVKLSVLILEKKLGRSLRKEEIVHHIDGNRLNDNPINLEATTRSRHMKQHSPIIYRWARQREYLAERKEQAIKLYNNGWNKNQIAKYMRIGKGTLYKYLDNNQ